MDSSTIFFVVCYQQFGLGINAVIKTVNMNTVTMNNNNSKLSISTTTNSGIIYQSNTRSSTTGNSWIYNSPNIEQDLIIEYIDMLVQILGIDINFEKFSKMTPEERKSYIRDLKLKKLID